VHADGFFGDLEHANAFHRLAVPVKYLPDGFAVQADGLEQLRAAVAHVGAHAHLGHDLGQALADGLDVVVDGLVGRQVARQSLCMSARVSMAR
jgi:predicted kinase